MDLSLVNMELSESRLYRSTESFKKLTGPDIASLFYLNTLALLILIKDLKQTEYGMEYAKKTAQGGVYTFFKSSGTDLYMLGFQINAPANTSTKISTDAKDYLAKLNFNNRQHWNIINKLGNNKIDDNMIVSFFFSLERQLRIGTAKYRNWRRLVLNWDSLSVGEREGLTRAMSREMKSIHYSGELTKVLDTMVTYNSFLSTDEEEPVAPNPSMLKRAAGTVAGATLGRYAGGKVADTLGKDVDKYKKVGTGLGAIAGYWSSGRTT